MDEQQKIFEVSEVNGLIKGARQAADDSTPGNREAAKVVGRLIAEQAKAKGIEAAVFDRNGFKYHGAVKELADAAREGGLEF